MVAVNRDVSMQWVHITASVTRLDLSKILLTHTVVSVSISMKYTHELG